MKIMVLREKGSQAGRRRNHVIMISPRLMTCGPDMAGPILALQQRST